MIKTVHHKEFEKKFNEFSGEHNLWKVFSDFCEMSAISFSNSIFKDEDREKRYLSIVGEYAPDEVKRFPELLGITINGLEDMDSDFLGEMFMSLELSNHWKGQFFTPFSICEMMGRNICGDDVEEKIKEKGFITIGEPACGAGATIIGLMRALRDRGINYQSQAYVHATDVDATAAHMCYIQLSLLHVPAVVSIGNSLSMEMRSSWYTPAHHMGFWGWKLQRSCAIGSAVDHQEPNKGMEQKTEERIILPTGNLQLSLF